MGVVVVQQKFQPTTTTEIPLANGSLTHEQALKVLAGAVELLRQRARLFAQNVKSCRRPSFKA